MTHMIKRRGYDILVANLQDPITGVTYPALIKDGSDGSPGATSSAFIGAIQAGTVANTSQFGLSIQYLLSCANEYTDLTQLFDRYKITGVKLKLMFQQNTAATTGQACLPVLNYSWDGDDATVPTSGPAVSVKAYSKTAILNGNRELKVFCKPRLSKEVYNTPLTSGYSSEKAVYLDCNSPNIPHYAHKMWIDNWLTQAETNSLVLRIAPTYYFALRDTQ